MANQESDLRSDPLFGGLTRPATILGVPIEAAVLIGGGATVGFLMTMMFGASIFWKLMALGFGAVLYGIARLICAKDPRSFRYVGLALETKAMHRSRKFWGCGSYSPLIRRKR
jgi:type IV secretion system protein VirB3